ncbi:MAG: 23S rRNA (adenine(2503)-C(2))-methyltransferase RlmN [Lachnospiraceae bacterium]
MTDIKSLNKTELTEYVVSNGFPKYRAEQLYRWMHVQLVRGYDEMNNIPGNMREFLKNNTEYTDLKVLACLESKKGDTKKFLFGLKDGNAIESVWMKYKHGNSVCISSQMGCRMGCRFCASTIGGLVRNLTPGEMLEQVYAITRETGERVSNVVIMGSGEPLDNFDTVVRFISMISDENGLNISQRNITLSTCGLVPGILKLADLKLNITLAISLHAYNDDKRKEIMPVAKSYPIKELLDACNVYFKKTGRRLSFEYSLIKGVNDSEADATGLAALLKNCNAHVNLIPVNPIKERDFRRSEITNVLQFQQMLEKKGINVTIRREMGADIDAACGQLRRSYEENRKGEGTHESICSN